jgi:drug/metabolite transporter (DMT)-like permease
MGLLLLTNLFTTSAWILFYFSYQISGVIYTILLFSIQPLLVYGAGIFLLEEKMEKRKLLAFTIVLAAIAIAQFFT